MNRNTTLLKQGFLFSSEGSLLADKPYAVIFVY
jgi:hypothetical protein